MKLIPNGLLIFCLLFPFEGYTKKRTKMRDKSYDNYDKFDVIQKNYSENYLNTKYLYLNSLHISKNINFIIETSNQNEHEKLTKYGDTGYEIKLDEFYPVNKIKIIKINNVE